MEDGSQCREERAVGIKEWRRCAILPVKHVNEDEVVVVRCQLLLALTCAGRCRSGVEVHEDEYLRQ